jgi:tRNA threonylcarbamoyl adenosine modification protein YeaZ
VILALETSTAAASAVVVDADGELLGASLSTGGPLQARRLLEGVHEALGAAGIALDEVETIVCGLGPGTFTGLRIGVATARALAQAAGLPLAGVPSLEALARGLAAAAADAASASVSTAQKAAALATAAQPTATPATAAHFVPLIDGRRNEVFAAVYRCDSPAAGGNVELVVGLTVIGAAALPEFLGRWPGAVVGGDGATLHADLLPATVAFAPAVTGPSALMVARGFLAGSPALTRGFADTLPLYGREPDALPRARGLSGPSKRWPSP